MKVIMEDIWVFMKTNLPLTSILVGVLISSIMQMVIKQGWIVQLVVIILAFGFVYLFLFLWEQNRGRRSWIRVMEESEIHPRGLVAAVSARPGTTAAENAIIKWQNDLEFCWLLYTDQSADNYHSLLKKYNGYQNGNGGTLTLFGRKIADPDNIGQVFDDIKDIYKDAGRSNHLGESEIIVDYTGGTASISAGMILATTLSMGRKLAYLQPNSRDKNGFPVEADGFKALITDLDQPRI